MRHAINKSTNQCVSDPLLQKSIHVSQYDSSMTNLPSHPPAITKQDHQYSESNRYQFQQIQSILHTGKTANQNFLNSFSGQK